MTRSAVLVAAVAVVAGWLYSLGVTLTGGGEVFSTDNARPGRPKNAGHGGGG